MSSFKKLSFVSLVATLFLVGIGGLVRATDSGLGCADAWPDCSGRWIPDFHNHHVVIEFTHRVVAGIVMILIATMVVRAFRIRHERPEMLKPSIAALALVFFQAGLGAVVVKLHLEKESVMLHLGAALALTAMLIYVVVKAHALDGSLAEPGNRVLNRIAQVAAGAVFVLLLVGSYTSGYSGAGRAFSDWPLMDGRLIPDLTVTEKAIHFSHRAIALVVGVILFAAMLKVIRAKAANPLAARFAHAAVGLFAIEVMIGAANVWTRLNAAFVTAHLLIGALIWACVVGVAVVTHPGLERARDPGPVGRRTEALGGAS